MAGKITATEAIILDKIALQNKYNYNYYATPNSFTLLDVLTNTDMVYIIKDMFKSHSKKELNKNKFFMLLTSSQLYELSVFILGRESGLGKIKTELPVSTMTDLTLYLRKKVFTEAKLNGNVWICKFCFYRSTLESAVSVVKPGSVPNYLKLNLDTFNLIVCTPNGSDVYECKPSSLNQGNFTEVIFEIDNSLLYVNIKT
jgi:hypothetical protein